MNTFCVKSVYKKTHTIIVVLSYHVIEYILVILEAKCETIHDVNCKGLDSYLQKLPLTIHGTVMAIYRKVNILIYCGQTRAHANKYMHTERPVNLVWYEVIIYLTYK